MCISCTQVQGMPAPDCLPFHLSLYGQKLAESLRSATDDARKQEEAISYRVINEFLGLSCMSHITNSFLSGYCRPAADQLPLHVQNFGTKSLLALSLSHRELQAHTQTHPCMSRSMKYHTHTHTHTQLGTDASRHEIVCVWIGGRHDTVELLACIPPSTHWADDETMYH